METLRLFIRISRPIFLIGVALLYALGVGIARYLGVKVDWGLYIFGQVWVITLQLGTLFLFEYFDDPQTSYRPNRAIFSDGSENLEPGKLPRITALVVAAACLTALASLSVLLIREARLTPPTVLIMGLAFSGALFYSVPPVRLATSGYGELLTSIMVSNLLPAFAFLIQVGELHRLMAMSTFPLTPLYLAMLLALELPDYAKDLKHQKLTLMVRMGWKNGMQIHNYLVLSAFLLLGLAMVFGLPIFIALPAFLSLPLAILQIRQMRRIAEGGKPNWTTLTITSVVIFAATTYLLTFTYWTR